MSGRQNKVIAGVLLLMLSLFSGCGLMTWKPELKSKVEVQKTPDLILSSTMKEIEGSPAFKGYGRLLFPMNKEVPELRQLKDVGLDMPDCTAVSQERTVAVVNTLKHQAEHGDRVFYDIYTEDEKAKDPSRKNTGLIFFKGHEGGKVAICSAGEGFKYVAAMHESFPIAQELANRGYNAFALIYRPGAQTGVEDLAKAIAFLHTHAEDLKINMKGYSLWGADSGGKMAAWLGSLGTENFGQKEYPKAGTVIMQYCDLADVYGNEPATYEVIGMDDKKVPYQAVSSRVSQVKARGRIAEVQVLFGVDHGFGLGEGTGAVGWLDNAVAFWEKNTK